MPRMAGFICGNRLGAAFGNDLAPTRAAFGAQIDQPVGGLDHIQIMFDHDHAVSCIIQPLQHFQQQVDVGIERWMTTGNRAQTCGGERPPRARLIHANKHARRIFLPATSREEGAPFVG